MVPPMASHSSIMAPCGPCGPSWPLTIPSCLLHGSLIIPLWYLMEPSWSFMSPYSPLKTPSQTPHIYFMAPLWSLMTPHGSSGSFMAPHGPLVVPHGPLMAQPLPTELCWQRVHAAPSLPLSPLSEVEPRPRSYGWLCPSNMPRS